MSDTPRTDTVLASYWNPWPRLRDLARELERELNSANATMRQQQKVSDDIREWLQTIPVVTDADKAELREAITRLEAQVIGPSALIDELEIERDRIAKLLKAQQRGTSNAEKMLCEILEVDDGSQILDAIQALKDRIKRLKQAGDVCLACSFQGMHVEAEREWRKAKEAKP